MRKWTDSHPKVLVLTPVKDAEKHAKDYFEQLRTIEYPHRLISIALLESDSHDRTEDAFRRAARSNSRRFRSTSIFKHDFKYRIPPGLPRWEPSIQLARRSVLARSRNHLLSRALTDEAWVLWLDVDVISYPKDILKTLLDSHVDIVQPNCVIEYGGESFDKNAWRNEGTTFLSDMRDEGQIVPLDSVGGTMLLINANCHRDGLIFPPFLYRSRLREPRSREDIGLPECYGEIETEGLAAMASDFGFKCWGLPNVEIVHAAE